MKVLVAVKRVIDPYVKIRVKPDGMGVELKNVKMSMNPFDEIAVEAALRLREQGRVTEVILVSIGPMGSQEILRHGLALGADRAILVHSEQAHCALNIAKILQKIALSDQVDLILMGKQSIDGDNNQTPQMLAGLLGWPQALFASSIQVEGPCLHVTREVDGGLETLKINTPAVISVDLRLNEPRYASLPNIMKAKQKPLNIIELDSFNLVLKKHIEILSVTSPPARQSGEKLLSVEALIEKLKHEAKVL